MNKIDFTSLIFLSASIISFITSLLCLIKAKKNYGFNDDYGDTEIITED